MGGQARAGWALVGLFGLFGTKGHAEEPARPNEQASLVCTSYAATVSPDQCLLVWGTCSDGASREVRCVTEQGQYRCDCILGSAAISTFTSADFCRLGESTPSINQAMLTEATRRSCGWKIAP